MATIKAGYGRAGFGDALPLIDVVLRDIADDLTAINGGAVAALTSVAPAAVTSVQEATTNAVDLTTSEALANSLKIKYNAAQVDIAALRLTLAAVQVDVAAIRAALSVESAALKTIKG